MERGRAGTPIEPVLRRMSGLGSPTEGGAENGESPFSTESVDLGGRAPGRGVRA